MKNPMQAFGGVDFDCEFKIRGQKSSNYSAGGHLKEKDLDSSIFNYRPRLNKEQVLEDYTPILVDGFVWEIDYGHFDGRGHGSRGSRFNINSNKVLEYDCYNGYEINHIMFLGVEKGSEWEEWAIENDIPVLEASS